MWKKNLMNRKLFKHNYYAVSIDEGYTQKITSDDIPGIKTTGKFEFTLTYDCSDHKQILPCKIVVESIETSKIYFDLPS